ncbi:MAG: tyrosine-type recombinase/integrase [Candidatus Dormibacteria bacterium]
MSRRFKAARERAFGPSTLRVRIHDLRHSFASIMINQGSQIAEVSELLGHASIQITIDLYAHLYPSTKAQAIRRLDDSLPPDSFQ